MQELWFTAPDEGSALQLAAMLQDVGHIVLEAPFDFQGPTQHRPSKPWTVVSHGVADTRALNLLAAALDCAYHPEGGEQRWA